MTEEIIFADKESMEAVKKDICRFARAYYLYKKGKETENHFQTALWGEVFYDLQNTYKVELVYCEVLLEDIHKATETHNAQMIEQ